MTQLTIFTMSQHDQHECITDQAHPNHLAMLARMNPLPQQEGGYPLTTRVARAPAGLAAGNAATAVLSTDDEVTRNSLKSAAHQPLSTARLTI